MLRACTHGSMRRVAAAPTLVAAHGATTVDAVRFGRFSKPDTGSFDLPVNPSLPWSPARDRHDIARYVKLRRNGTWGEAFRLMEANREMPKWWGSVLFPKGPWLRSATVSRGSEADNHPALVPDQERISGRTFQQNVLLRDLPPHDTKAFESVRDYLRYPCTDDGIDLRADYLKCVKVAKERLATAQTTDSMKGNLRNAFERTNKDPKYADEPVSTAGAFGLGLQSRIYVSVVLFEDCTRDGWDKEVFDACYSLRLRMNDADGFGDTLSFRF